MSWVDAVLILAAVVLIAYFNFRRGVKAGRRGKA